MAGSIIARVEGLRDTVEGNISDFKKLQGSVQNNEAAAQDWLEKGKVAQRVMSQMLIYSPTLICLCSAKKQMH